MSKLLAVPLFLLLLAAPAYLTAADNEVITQDELVHRTQELLDAVAGGDQRPWREYYADDAMFFDERGRGMDKTALVADITPLPKGYSGNIKVLKPQSRIVGYTAILSYDLDESETVYGQDQKARYHGTDTWLYRNGQWQIVATQMFRYYEDPAPGKIGAERLNDYVGSYAVAPGITMTVTREGDKLYSKREKRPQQTLVPETCDLFFRPGVEGRFLFRRNDSGKVDALVDRRNNEDIVWKKM